MEQEKILRINELAKKKKEVGLTDEETRERSALYAQYIKEFREQTEATLKRVRVEQEDGSFAEETFCYENGIMTGSDQKLNPGAAITRQEFAAVLQRTMKLFAENGLAEIVPGDGMAVYEFSDSRSIQNWAISSVSFCIKNHLMQGDNRNAFNPTGNVNRAQVAKALSNIAAAAKK